MLVVYLEKGVGRGRVGFICLSGFVHGVGKVGVRITELCRLWVRRRSYLDSF